VKPADSPRIKRGIIENIKLINSPKTTVRTRISDTYIKE
jgi:hypothetical protein